MYGSSAGTGTSYGVYGSVTGSSNTGYGVYALNNSTSGWGVYAAGSSPNYFSGNVGIGTASPTATLDVRSGSTGTIQVTNDYGAIRLKQDNGTGFRFVLNADGKLRLQDSTDSFASAVHSQFTVWDSANGNVGIGTATPAEKLEVAGNIKASGTLQVANSAATCTVAADYGKFRYNPVNGKLQICKP